MMPSAHPVPPVDATDPKPVAPPAPASAELLILPDGRILAHHLTPELADAVRAALDAPDAPETRP
jgi:hypothetical protein